MKVREAKNFLVHQAVEQASLENVPFSDLERRMMYFTESGEMLESPFELNAAFEGEYNSAEYEVKVSKLMSHAYARLKKEDPSSARIWDDSVQELRKGDHYLLVFLDQAPIGSAPGKHMFGWTFWKVLGIGILVLIVGLVVFTVMLHYSESGSRR